MKKITVVESNPYLNIVKHFWDEDERSEFLNYIAGNYEQGDVIPDSGGLRKIRWIRSGIGKRKAVR